MATRVQTNEKERISVIAVDAAGVLVAGLTVSITVLRQDGTWFNGSTRTWSSTLFANPMPENVNRPGQYDFMFWPADGDFQCSFVAEVTGGTDAADVINSPWAGDMLVGFWVDNIDAPISAADDTSAEILKRIGGGQGVSDELRRQRGILDEIMRK